MIFGIIFQKQSFCGLTIADIDFKEKRIRVNYQLQRTSQMEYVIEAPKKEKGVRYVPLTEEVTESFQRIIKNRTASKVESIIEGYTGFLFLDKNDMLMFALHWEKYMQHILEKYNNIYNEFKDRLFDVLNDTDNLPI